MKKSIFFSLAACACLALAGCGSAQSTGTETVDKMQVVEETAQTPADAKPLEISQDVKEFTMYEGKDYSYNIYVTDVTNPNEDYYINNVNVSYKVQDKEGRVLNTGSLDLPSIIGPGETVMSEVSVFNSDGNVNNLTFTFSANEEQQEYIPADELKNFSAEAENIQFKQPYEDEINVTMDVKNETGYDDMDFFVSVIPYKNGKPVWMITQISPSLDQGETGLVRFNNYPCPDFDNVEVQVYPMRLPKTEE